MSTVTVIRTDINPTGDAGDTSPPIFWLRGRQWEYPPIFLCTFGYSRPILVVLAQWQHLMMYFFTALRQKSKICRRIDPNPTEGAHDKEKL